MQTATLTSSALHSTSIEDGDLYVTFCDGAVWKYAGQADHFQPLVDAESAGRYYNANIRRLEGIQVG